MFLNLSSTHFCFCFFHIYRSVSFCQSSAAALVCVASVTCLLLLSVPLRCVPHHLHLLVIHPSLTCLLLYAPPLFTCLPFVPVSPLFVLSPPPAAPKCWQSSSGEASVVCSTGSPPGPNNPPRHTAISNRPHSSLSSHQRTGAIHHIYIYCNIMNFINFTSYACGFIPVLTAAQTRRLENNNVILSWNDYLAATLNSLMILLNVNIETENAQILCPLLQRCISVFENN